ncbi:MAG: energy-coupling factor transporter transmembrane protein EcfT [Treponema sp.]|jgi:cobalt/nickel transport system permease protein|nr:energy-coupling factor transporter transmembrane protein EcfT [Treponema sp.]
MYLDRLEFEGDPCKGFDPRCRIAAALILILLVISLRSPLMTGAIMLGAAAPFLRDKGDRRKLGLRLIPVNLFTLTLYLSQILQGLWKGALLEALGRSVHYTLRINAAALLYMVWVIPLGIGGLANGLRKLKVPASLIALLVLSYRYIFVLYQGFFGALLAMRLRRPRQHTLEQWRSYTAVFATALVKALIRAQKIEQALLLRGFGGALPLSRVFIWRVQDSVLLGACIILSMSLVIAERLWHF